MTKRIWIGLLAVAALLAGGAAVGTLSGIFSTPNQPPVVQIVSPEEGETLSNRQVRFEARVSDPDGKIAEYEWIFDDNVRRPIKLGEPKPSLKLDQERVYGEGGQRRVTLRVTDDRGATGQTSRTFRLNQAPVARISPGSPSGEAPLEVRFDGTHSYDQDGEIVKYDWDFNDDGEKDAEGAQVQHTFAEPGLYPITLIVTDDAGESASATVQVALEAASSGVAATEGEREGITVVDFEGCHVERWTDSQGRQWFHVNISQYPNPYLVWETFEGSPPLTKSGTFENPEAAQAAEFCAAETDGKALGVDYDVTVPGSFAGAFIWLNRENPDLLQVRTESEKYALMLRLKGDSGKVKIELKLPGFGWFYVYKPIQMNWQEYTIPLDEFNKLEDWPARERMEFVVTLENRVLQRERRRGTIYLDDIAFALLPETPAKPEPPEGKIWLDLEDPEGDDDGPGTYVYPTHPLFQQETFDIVRFRVLEEERDLIFRFTLDKRIRNPWGAPHDMSVQAFDVYLDTKPGGHTDLIFDQTIPGNLEENPDGTLNAVFDPEDGWEFAMRCQGWEAALFTTPSGLQGNKRVDISDIEVDAPNGVVTCRVEKSLVGTPTGNWKVTAFSFGIDWGNARVVDAQPSEWHFGGGADDKSDPNIIDLIVPPDSAQEEVLDFQEHSPVILPMIPLVQEREEATAGTPGVLQPTPSSESGRLAQAPLDELLDEIERRAIDYFWEEANPENGLIKDRSTSTSPSSIAAVGFGLTALAAGAERGWLPKDEVYQRVLTTLRFLKDGVENVHGLYYHFLDMRTGERVWQSEVSTIDTALLLAGVLFAGEYFKGTEVENLAQEIYKRVEWPWFLANGDTLSMCWTPKKGFCEARWANYSEHMIMYLLGIGSPTHPLPPEAWDAWGRPVKQRYDLEYIYETGESLFTYQYSHAFVDFRDKHDRYADYSHNSINATKANRRFVIEHKEECRTFDDDIWGLTAGDGPDGYKHYGARPGGFDCTINPYGMVASMPFVPELAEQGIRTLLERYGGRIWDEYGFTSGFNVDHNWYSDQYVGLDQGIIAIMLENFQTGFVWETFMNIEPIQQAMEAVNFVEEPLEGGPLTPWYKEQIEAQRREAAQPRAVGLQVQTPLTIDGSLEDWQQNGALKNIVTASQLVLGQLPPNQTLESTFYALWDSDYLYLATEVKDDIIVSNIAPDDVRDLYRTDSIEFYIDPRRFNPEAQAGVFKLAAIPFDTEGDPQAARHEDADPGPIAEVAPEVQLSSQRTEKGYVIEVAIPWTYLGVGPRIGLKLGFSHTVHNADDPGVGIGQYARTAMIAWTAVSEVWARPEDWGILILQ